MKNKATVLGLMSGSSLDGLDACLVELEKVGSSWQFQILEAQTLPIPEVLTDQLRMSAQLPAKQLLALDAAYGEWIGSMIAPMTTKADLIALHGHTVFHSPQDKISVQIGSGEVISLRTRKVVVANFRNRDILLGGQGAPLVPMGEKLLFPNYDGFLNLGGICNATFRMGDQWIAGDIGPFNQVFNHFAKLQGAPMDTNGDIAKSGKMIPELTELWNTNPYFSEPFPKSLANQWVAEHFLVSSFSPEDTLHSFAHFISDQIASIIRNHHPAQTLITGGGAKNTFLMNLLQSKCAQKLVIPENEIVDFKEALIFALLGLLRLRGEVNVLATCTGARQDSSSGILFSAGQNG
jgi:anhydro-N-acetylmuramic acid kinase